MSVIGDFVDRTKARSEVHTPTPTTLGDIRDIRVSGGIRGIRDIRENGGIRGNPGILGDRDVGGDRGGRDHRGAPDDTGRDVDHFGAQDVVLDLGWSSSKSFTTSGTDLVYEVSTA